MNKSQQIVSLLVLVVLVSTLAAECVQLNKVFSYQGSMPIKEAVNGVELVKADTNTSAVSQEQKEAEAACWRKVNEESYVNFARQDKVLEELRADLEKINVDAKLKYAIEKIAKSMQDSFNEAREALKRDRADEYFDSLFEASEEIIHMAVVLRNPDLEDEVFVALVKAVSRLSRNNSLLIQSFADLCSVAHRSPRPRLFAAASPSIRGFW